MGPLILMDFSRFNYCRSSHRSGFAVQTDECCRGNVCEIGRESIMAVQEPQCCELNGRSSKGNRRL
jgi:hypothetical protein